MRTFIATGVFLLLAACTQIVRRDNILLSDLQGGWWSNCEDPAVAFLIDGNKYSGDFSGTYTLGLAGNVLTFSAGLIDGHSIDVPHKPLSFRILSATGDQLLLRPMLGNPYVGDWRLHSCNGAPPKIH